MALQAQHIADDAEEFKGLISDAARAGDEANTLLASAANTAERVGLISARDFYRAAAMLTARANAEVVNAGGET